MDSIAWHEYRTPGRLAAAGDGSARFVVAGDHGPTLAVDVHEVPLPPGFDQLGEVALLGRCTLATHLLMRGVTHTTIHEGERLAKAIGTVTAMLYTDSGERVWVLDCGFTLLYAPAPDAYVAAGRAGEWFEVRFDAPLEVWQFAHGDAVIERQARSDEERPAEASR